MGGDESYKVAAKGLIAKLEDVIFVPLVELLVAVALLYFLWGAYQFVANAESDSARSDGKQHMLWGIIGMLVMLSALAILKIAIGTFGVTLPD